MKRFLWLSLGWIYVILCPFMLGGFISLVLFGPWGVAIETLIWTVIFGWFDGSKLQHDLT